MNLKFKSFQNSNLFCFKRNSLLRRLNGGGCENGNDLSVIMNLHNNSEMKKSKLFKMAVFLEVYPAK